ncbi:hypothetical protein NYE70_17885 [Paenibacillus sp. FSL R5-0407]|uniref:hypothetical protein n=1 Tax=Paenibacillus sp. FSL R5-0407 TaxID=2975320 RepID=UPI0030F9EAA3
MSRISFRGKKQIMSREGSSKSNQNITLKELHAIFITAKRAEGLRDSTLKEHTSHFQYFTTWLENNEHTSFLNERT